ncbi:hypothetical protein SPOG_04105 [Schizosaccharomyces cryophilus OY26]|uniref:Uncharacterized protein n=1 Tax=Schizosaccharomyces cryophilus (strain OY26 / ATCC MYA-4695 / CBS 11777 / NBRC 106824 / NRRL Y48691) TaxID=653667 RepID=S9XAN3_SCHCR|nr:uncharacterized protein SPOG_04105 [Schizosaccharomyces cryophilus OY26]EPY54212.1 hypothetical protein SPOG_04105 [Schizosaccharomyces cryophilus OY26]
MNELCNFCKDLTDATFGSGIKKNNGVFVTDRIITNVIISKELPTVTKMNHQALLLIVSASLCSVWVISKLASHRVLKALGFCRLIFESLIEDVETIVFLKFSSLEEAISCFEQHNQPNPMNNELRDRISLLRTIIFQIKSHVSMDYQKNTLISRICSGICYLLEYKRFKHSFKRLAKKSSIKAGCSFNLSQCEFHRLMAADETFNRNVRKTLKEIRRFVSEYAVKYLFILLFLRAMTFLAHKFSINVDSPSIVKLNLSQTLNRNVLLLIFFILCLQGKSCFRWFFTKITFADKSEFRDNSMINCEYSFPEKDYQHVEDKGTEFFNLEKRKENMKAFLESITRIRPKEKVRNDFSFEKISLRNYASDIENDY